MKKEIYLVNFIIEEELKLYRQRKNINLVIKLSKQYYEYLDVFFKKKTDILFKYRVYNHVINLKEESLFSSFRLYNINCNKM